MWATVCGVFFCIFGNEGVLLEQQSHFGNCAGDWGGMGPAMGVPFAARPGGVSILLLTSRITCCTGMCEAMLTY
jgi:hypothetical protein